MTRNPPLKYVYYLVYYLVVPSFLINTAQRTRFRHRTCFFFVSKRTPLTTTTTPTTTRTTTSASANGNAGGGGGGSCSFQQICSSRFARFLATLSQHARHTQKKTKKINTKKKNTENLPGNLIRLPVGTHFPLAEPGTVAAIFFWNTERFRVADLWLADLAHWRWTMMSCPPEAIVIGVFLDQKKGNDVITFGEISFWFDFNWISKNVFLHARYNFKARIEFQQRRYRIFLLSNCFFLFFFFLSFFIPRWIPRWSHPTMKTKANEDPKSLNSCFWFSSDFSIEGAAGDGKDEFRLTLPLFGCCCCCCCCCCCGFRLIF